MKLEYMMHQEGMSIAEFLLERYGIKRASNWHATQKTLWRKEDREEYQANLVRKHQEAYEKKAKEDFMLKEEDLRRSKKNAATASMVISQNYASCLIKIAGNQPLTDQEKEFLSTVKKYSMVKGLDDILKQAMLLLWEPTSNVHTTGSMNIGWTDPIQASQALRDLQDLHNNNE